MVNFFYAPKFNRNLASLQKAHETTYLSFAELLDTIKANPRQFCEKRCSIIRYSSTPKGVIPLIYKEFSVATLDVGKLRILLLVNNRYGNIFFTDIYSKGNKEMENIKKDVDMIAKRIYSTNWKTNYKV